MDLSKNINIRDDFGDWWKRGLDLFCKAEKPGWVGMYTSTRVDNDGNWNVGTINMFATRPATELATSTGCSVVKDITPDIARFFKPSCDYQ